MRKDVLVTLADENYVEQAKQLFSSVYWNSGWKGDYLLLSNGISDDDLEWFIKKGIIVRKIDSLVDKGFSKFWSRIVYDKFYLFQDYFKKWRKIVFLDSDIIVRGSLNKLLSVRGIGGVKLFYDNKLKNFLWNSGMEGERVFIDKEKMASYKIQVRKLNKIYDLNKSAFNSGLLVIDSNIIGDEVFNGLKKYLNDYGIASKADDGILSLYFYDKWEELPYIYNVCPNLLRGIEFNGVVMHFVHKPKPWEKMSDYYGEWVDNLENAEKIDLDNRPRAGELEVIGTWSIYLKSFLKFLFLRLDRAVGNFGLVIKDVSPKFYYKLRWLAKNE